MVDHRIVNIPEDTASDLAKRSSKELAIARINLMYIQQDAELTGGVAPQVDGLLKLIDAEISRRKALVN